MQTVLKQRDPFVETANNLRQRIIEFKMLEDPVSHPTTASLQHDDHGPTKTEPTTHLFQEASSLHSVS